MFVTVCVCVSEWAGSESGGYGHWATARCADFLKERKRLLRREDECRGVV